MSETNSTPSEVASTSKTSKTCDKNLDPKSSVQKKRGSWVSKTNPCGTYEQIKREMTPKTLKAESSIFHECIEKLFCDINHRQIGILFNFEKLRQVMPEYDEDWLIICHISKGWKMLKSKLPNLRTADLPILMNLLDETSPTNMSNFSKERKIRIMIIECVSNIKTYSFSKKIFKKILTHFIFASDPYFYSKVTPALSKTVPLARRYNHYRKLPKTDTEKKQVQKIASFLKSVNDERFKSPTVLRPRLSKPKQKRKRHDSSSSVVEVISEGEEAAVGKVISEGEAVLIEVISEGEYVTDLTVDKNAGPENDMTEFNQAHEMTRNAFERILSEEKNSSSYMPLFDRAAEETTEPGPGEKATEINNNTELSKSFMANVDNVKI